MPSLICFAEFILLKGGLNIVPPLRVLSDPKATFSTAC